MVEHARVFTARGVDTFRQHLENARHGSLSTVPGELLSGSEYSEELESIELELKTFQDRFQFGRYLADQLSVLDRRAVSRNHGLWTWLAAYYFEQICPPTPDGQRKVFADEAYILPSKYDFQSYYRHLVRTPWLAVNSHGNCARVLLIPAGRSEGAPLARRGEIIEQLASRQALLGNPTVIAAADRLYFDADGNRPRRGTGGSKGGSPRRLALILQQLDLTFDLPACDVDRLLALLPKEFDRWKETPVGAV